MIQEPRRLVSALVPIAQIASGDDAQPLDRANVVVGEAGQSIRAEYPAPLDWLFPIWFRSRRDRENYSAPRAECVFALSLYPFQQSAGR